MIGGMSGAYFLNNRAARALLQIEALCSLIGYIRSQVECFALPIGEIFEKCEPSLLFDCGWQEKDAPQTLCELTERCEFYDAAAQKAVCDLALDFGKSYIDESLKQCDLCVSLLRERKRELLSELPKKKKLNATLCVSGALAVIILLI